MTTEEEGEAGREAGGCFSSSWIRDGRRGGRGASGLRAAGTTNHQPPPVSFCGSWSPPPPPLPPFLPSSLTGRFWGAFSGAPPTISPGASVSPTDRERDLASGAGPLLVLRFE
ncbi:hypothetical protein VZT92_018540 [Zoarces viviparus]|uniref:Uncharacterized protein n=1 Tax=Zoarces viviparus TaxID=48416 RepID=A0AAW1EIM7_ZOAVI